MGACDFYVVAKGATADKAFASAVSDAKYAVEAAVAGIEALLAHLPGGGE